MSYFDFSNINTNLILKFLKSNPDFEYEVFLQSLGKEKADSKFELMHDNDDQSIKLNQAVTDKSIVSKQYQDLQESLKQKNSQFQPLKQNESAQFKKRVIRIQAWIRMMLVKKRLWKQYQQMKLQQTKTISKDDLNKQIMTVFASGLKKKKLTAEGFFRANDKKGNGALSIEEFRQGLIDMAIMINKDHIARLIKLIDENFSGDITIDELRKTMKAYQMRVESNEQEQLTIEQVTLLKVFEVLRSKEVSPMELFSSIDVDNSMSLSLQEVQQFLSGLINEDEYEKQIMDKEFMIFINFMDIDNNGQISKAEFLKQFQKLELLYSKYGDIYKKLMSQAKEQSNIGKRNNTNENATEQQVRTIIKQMQEEGLAFDSFIKQLASQVEQNNQIKLGPLLRQFQLSFPTLTLDQVRSLLKWLHIQGGKYDITEMEVFLFRFSDDKIFQNSLLQTLLVCSQQIKLQKSTPEQVLNKLFENMNYISFEIFSKTMQDAFCLPIECVIEVFNSLLIDQQQNQVMQSDLLDVLNSYFYDSTKISLSNVGSHIMNYDKLTLAQKKQKILQLISQRIKERRIQAMSLFKIADSKNLNSVIRTQIHYAFQKLLPLFTEELINFVFPNDQYKKEEFTKLLAIDDGTATKVPDSAQSKFMSWVGLLDQALLQLKLSPSYLFRQADKNKNGSVDMKELKVFIQDLFNQLKQKGEGLEISQEFLNDQSIISIIKELDTNGNGQLEEEEFFALIHRSREYNSKEQQTQQIMQIDRLSMLPTRETLSKIQNIRVGGDQQGHQNLSLNDDLVNAIKQIDQVSSLKDSLASCSISHNLTIKLRELSQILKQKGVEVKLIAGLYRHLDTSHFGQMNILAMITLLNEYLILSNQPFTCNLELNYICKLIYLSLSLSVQEYFQRQAKILTNPSDPLIKESVAEEFRTLFKLPSNIANSIYNIMVNKYQYGLKKVLNQHMYEYLQDVYNQVCPQEQKIFDTNKQLSNLQRNTQNAINQAAEPEISNMSQKNVIVKLVMAMKGREDQPLIIGEVMAKHGFPLDKLDISFGDLNQIFVVEHHLLTLNELKLFFKEMQDTMGIDSTYKLQKLPALEFVTAISKLETQICSSEIKQLTLKLEAHPDVGDLADFIVSRIDFIQSGVISKFSLYKKLVQLLCHKEKQISQVEVRFLLNCLDKDNNFMITIQEFQEYFRLYTKNRQISSKLLYRYFAYAIDRDFNQQKTIDVMKIDQSAKFQSTQDSQLAFISILSKLFVQVKDSSMLRDLYDMIGVQTADSDFSNVISFLITQIDLYRKIPQHQKYQLKNNSKIRNEIMSELHKHRPNFQVYKIMDDLVFSEDGVIPFLTLQHHLRKLYPYAEESKLKMFVNLVDFNSDKRIEIQELFRFFDELYNNEITCKLTMSKIASIIYSTQETVESFFLSHDVNLEKILKTQVLTFNQYVDIISYVFKISKYEAYIIFEELKVQGKLVIEFSTFLNQLKSLISQMIANDKAEDNSNVDLDQKLQQQKQEISKLRLEQAQKQHDKLNPDQKEGLQGQYKDEISSSSSQRIKMQNVEILKMFLDHYTQLNVLPIIKKACLSLQILIKDSARLRAQLFTRRACQIQDIYNQLGKESNVLSESEILIVSVLAMENVSRSYECNVHRFQKMIQGLKEKSFLDFQMLQKVLEQRHSQIEEMLFDDYLTIQILTEKVRKHVGEYQNVPELHFKEDNLLEDVLNLLASIYNLSFKPKELELIQKELFQNKQNTKVQFGKLQSFLANCNIKCKMEEELRFVFETIEEAKVAIDVLADHLSKHPYVNLNEKLITKQEFLPVSWSNQDIKTQQQQVKAQLAVISPIHKNSLMIDVVLQLQADQMESDDQVSKLILEYAPKAIKSDIKFLIISIGEKFVICDSTLPLNQGGQPLYTQVQIAQKLPYIEKALAIYLKGYEQISTLTNVHHLFQILEAGSQIERYTLKIEDKYKSNYQDLHDNYFQKELMRHIHFRMPPKKKPVSTLIDGLETGRIYSIIGMIQVKGEKAQSYSLVVVYNPLVSEDPRKSGEMWSKAFLQNLKKNKKVLDQIIQRYGQEVYDFISDKVNNVYTYDFFDIFNGTEQQEQVLLPVYKLISEQSIEKHALNLEFQNGVNESMIDIIVAKEDPPRQIVVVVNIDLNEDSVFSYDITLQNSQSQYIFLYQQLNYRQPMKKGLFSTKEFGRSFTMTLFLETAQSYKLLIKQIIDAKLNENKMLMDDLDLTIFHDKSCPLKIQYKKPNPPPQIAKDKKKEEEAKSKSSQVQKEESKDKGSILKIDQPKPESQQSQIHNLHELDTSKTVISKEKPVKTSTILEESKENSIQSSKTMSALTKQQKEQSMDTQTIQKMKTPLIKEESKSMVVNTQETAKESKRTDLKEESKEQVIKTQKTNQTSDLLNKSQTQTSKEKKDTVIGNENPNSQSQQVIKSGSSPSKESKLNKSIDEIKRQQTVKKSEATSKQPVQNSPSKPKEDAKVTVSKDEEQKKLKKDTSIEKKPSQQQQQTLTSQKTIKKT